LSTTVNNESYLYFCMGDKRQVEKIRVRDN
jgi:hypothetical protein